MSFILDKLDKVKNNSLKKEEEDEMLSRDSDFNNYEGPATGTKTDSLLSSDAAFKGTISFKSFLRIDGKFEGEVNSKGTLFVGKTGIVQAQVNVGNIIVEGKMKGNVNAVEKVDLRLGAQLFGDIKAQKLIIAEGVSFVGHCDVNPNNEKLDLSETPQAKNAETSEKPKEKPQSK